MDKTQILREIRSRRCAKQHHPHTHNVRITAVSYVRRWPSSIKAQDCCRRSILPHAALSLRCDDTISNRQPTTSFRHTALGRPPRITHARREALWLSIRNAMMPGGPLFITTMPGAPSPLHRNGGRASRTHPMQPPGKKSDNIWTASFSQG